MEDQIYSVYNPTIPYPNDSTDSPNWLHSIRESLDPNCFFDIFSALGDLRVFMKDREGCFIAGNDAWIHQLGLSDEKDLLGKTDHDFFPKNMVQTFLADDAKIFANGSPILRRIELVGDHEGNISWHSTSKFPLKNKDKEIVGVLVITYGLEQDQIPSRHSPQMEDVLSYIKSNFHKSLKVEELAKVASLSESHFQRKFRDTFGASVLQFIMRYRISRAAENLAQTHLSITEISLNCGFYDHSHFSREFQKQFGVPPTQYRKEWSQRVL
ncbi:MAG: helix-turn-helix domain-containing protein [Opitutales bacterium]